jgi:serine/threonine protein kinase, bacterial
MPRFPDSTELPVLTFLAAQGEIFARFERQDSGNLSYGVRVGDARYFVKTAGTATTALTLTERITLLRNAVRIAAIGHPALVPLRQVVESPAGPLLVYEWVEGELVGVERARRDDPGSTFARFRALPVPEILAALDVVFDLHERLAAAGFIAVDFYDGSLLYDFAAHVLNVIDLDHYQPGPFINQQGRLFGSSRFMAPEEHQLGAGIDQRTNVFTLGRTIAVFLSDGTLAVAPFRAGPNLLALARRACAPEPAQRFDTVAEFHRAWRALRSPA